MSDMIFWAIIAAVLLALPFLAYVLRTDLIGTMRYIMSLFQIQSTSNQGEGAGTEYFFRMIRISEDGTVIWQIDELYILLVLVPMLSGFVRVLFHAGQILLSLLVLDFADWSWWMLIPYAVDAFLLIFAFMANVLLFEQIEPVILATREFLWGYRLFMVCKVFHVSGLTSLFLVPGTPRVIRTPERGNPRALTTQVMQGTNVTTAPGLGRSDEQYIKQQHVWRFAIYETPRLVVDTWLGYFKRNGSERTIAYVEDHIIDLAVSQSDGFYQQRTMDDLMLRRKLQNEALLEHLRTFLDAVAVKLLQSATETVLDIDDAGYVTILSRTTRNLNQATSIKVSAVADADAQKVAARQDRAAFVVQQRAQVAKYIAQRDALEQQKQNVVIQVGIDLLPQQQRVDLYKDPANQRAIAVAKLGDATHGELLDSVNTLFANSGVQLKENCTVVGVGSDLRNLQGPAGVGKLLEIIVDAAQHIGATGSSS